MVALLAAACAVAAAALGFGTTWSHLGDERRDLTPSQAARAAAVHEHLPVQLFDRLEARLHRGDRWWLDVPEGAAQALAHRGDVYRAYAVYWFLPALPADSREDATVVFTIRNPK